MELKFLSLVEQTAQFLREQISQGRWTGAMPGKHLLAKELGINHKTAMAALRLLEKEGLLSPQEAGRNRRIKARARTRRENGLRIGLMLWTAADRAWVPLVELQHRLEKLGHQVICPQKTLMDLKMDVKQVARVVGKSGADAWMVVSAPGEVLEWFAKKKFPTFAIYGRYMNLPVAAVGASSGATMTEITQRLIGMGHRRLVMLARRQHRVPRPTQGLTAFLATLEANGIAQSAFCLPDWEESATGFHACLQSLFQLTPPTALLFDESIFYFAALQFLALRGIRVPQDVSLFCSEQDPAYAWCVPKVAHARADYTNMVKMVLRWARQISRGKKDIRQNAFPLNYVPGGTMGTARVEKDKLEQKNMAEAAKT